MKTSAPVRNGVTPEVAELIGRPVSMIPRPEKRAAIGDVTVSLPDGKPRIAEDVSGRSRNTTEPGINGFRSEILCVDDLSDRRKPGIGKKTPGLLSDIIEIMNPRSQSRSHPRTTLLYTDLTAGAVYEALLLKGWNKDELPAMRTISDISNRNGYRLQTAENTKVRKKRKTRTESSGM